MTSGQCNVMRKQLCEIFISRSNLIVRGYGPDTYFEYVCTVTWTWGFGDMTLGQGHLVVKHPWVMDNNCVKNYQDPT